MNSEKKERWQYRFDNYKRAFTLLREAIEDLGESDTSQLEKEGIIQRFEYTWELAWKTLKDYLNYEGIILDKYTPRSTIRAAAEAKIISKADIWMEALDARNEMSHTYDFKKFEETIQKIQEKYLMVLDELYTFFLEKNLERPS